MVTSYLSTITSSIGCVRRGSVWDLFLFYDTSAKCGTSVAPDKNKNPANAVFTGFLLVGVTGFENVTHSKPIYRNVSKIRGFQTFE